MKTELEIKNNVFMENELRIIANKETKRFMSALRPYVGQIIRNKTGQLSKKISDLLPVVDLKQLVPPLEKKGFARLHYCHLSVTDYSLYLEMSICFNGGSYDVRPSTAYCHYVNMSAYIGDMDKNTLKSIYEEKDYELYDEKEQANLYKKASDLLEKFEETNTLLMAKNKVNYR